MVKIKQVLAILLAFMLESEFMMTVISGFLGVIGISAIVTLVIVFWGFFKFVLALGVVVVLLYVFGKFFQEIIAA
jgi:hypothetical protein